MSEHERPGDESATQDTAAENNAAEETPGEHNAAEGTAAEEGGGEAPTPEAGPRVAAAPEPRRLTRSRDDRVIAGVCGGLGEYLGIDSVIVRIAALVLVFAGGAGIVLYLIGWIAMPEAPRSAEAGETVPSSAEAHGRRDERSSALVLGLVFVALGAFFLVDEIWSDFLAWKYVWPIGLILIGLVIILRPRR